jgi:2-haloacid dehalogenase
MDGIKTLAFDTGGTILDWHSGIVAALAEAGARSDVAADWHALANDYRRNSLGRILGSVDPGFTIDWVHRVVLDEILPAHGLTALSGDERQAIVRQWHALEAWPDFVPALEILRQGFVCVSFTILSLSLVIDVSRRNGIVWDAVIACEMLRVYKTQPEAYRRAAAHLALMPDEILMVACHNFDLDSARREGYRTAFVRRPAEWGPAGPPDPTPNPACDLIVDGFGELANALVR